MNLALAARLSPGKSDNRTFEVILYFSGYRVYQDLAQIHGYRAELT
jgi:hypothetical protein